MTYSSAADGPPPGGYPAADDDTATIPAHRGGSVPTDDAGGTAGDGSGGTPADDPARASGDGAGERPGAVPLAGGGRIRQQLRRRRRLVVALVSVLAGLLALALCGGLVAALAGLDRREDRGDRDERRGTASRELDCLELEKRLNQVSPPGAAADAAKRAAAVRDENAALRPYLTQVELRGPARHDDGDRLAWWRQLLDARTAYAEALDRQAAARTPAFFLPPRLPNGTPVAERLANTSPGACAGPIRRLAVPDL